MKRIILHAWTLIALTTMAISAHTEIEFTESAATENDSAPVQKKSRQSVEDRLYYMERKITEIKTATAHIPTTQDLARIENKIDQLTSDILALNIEQKNVMPDMENIELGTPLTIEVAEISAPVSSHNEVVALAQNSSTEIAPASEVVL